MKGTIKYIAFIVLVIFALACKKNKLGGKSEIKGTVQHHSKFIANARVFIKFNATELPGTDTSLYDAKVWTDSKGDFSIKCYKGNYYLYGFGYDDSFKRNVFGGVPVKIRNNEKVEIDLAVTE